VPERFELTLSGAAYGGEAFGRQDDGRMVFVAFAAPGERIVAELTEQHERWARARCVEVLDASPARVTPRCQHFTHCGGCHYQHLSYPAQLAVKREIVAAQLQRLGGFIDPPLEPIVASPTAWNTRNHMQFSIHSDGRLALQAAGSQRTIPIQECHLPEPPLDRLRRSLDIEPTGGLRRVALRCASDEDCLVLFEADRGPEVEFSTDLSASIVWATPAGTSVLSGADHVRMQVGAHAFRVSAGSFFQVHTPLAVALASRVLAALQVTPGVRVLDLYAGVGLFSAFIAQAGASVVAVEASPVACADFETNLDRFDSIHLYEATVDAALPAIEAEAGAVVVDPPRAGLGAAVVDLLLARRPPRLVYVSCDPATLARDGRRLADAGYRLESVTPFDLFPQTYHIETLSVWSL
jgi:23S rRNA (uracil1939-C5)-methyltransferase